MRLYYVLPFVLFDLLFLNSHVSGVLHNSMFLSQISDSLLSQHGALLKYHTYSYDSIIQHYYYGMLYFNSVLFTDLIWLKGSIISCNIAHG